MSESATDLPSELAGYEVLSELGRGGMGSVYLGRRVGPGGFHKLVAIKRVHPHLAKEEEFSSMFLDEARIAATIQHPNVAQVFELKSEGGSYLLVMEYLHGLSLHDLLKATKGKPFAIEVALLIASRAAEGLHAAHEARDPSGMSLGLVHRDVTPQNIFLTFDGRVKLTDFGVSKAEGRLVQTESGWIKGKAGYMGPEQLQGDPIDRRLDLFALGVVLWEMLTARRLFKRASQAETMMSIVSGDTSPASTYNANVTPELDALVARALSANPDDRFATAREFQSAIENILANSESAAGSQATMIEETITTLAPELREEREAIVKTPASATLLRAPKEESGVKVRESTPGPAQSRGGLALLAVVALVAVVGVVIFATRQEPAAETTGTLRVDSDPPNARIVLDGETRAENTPALLEGVALGRHSLHLELADHTSTDRSVDVSVGTTRVRVTLDHVPEPGPEPGPEPTMAAVVVEQGAVEEPDETAATEEAATEAATEEAGAATAVAMDARRRRRRRTSEMEPTTPPATAFLNLITVPSVRVFIRGRLIGRTPMRRREIPAGRSVLELRPDEGEPERVTINAAAGETVAVPRVVLAQ